MIAENMPGARDTQLMRGSLELCVLAAIAAQPSHTYELCERLRSHGLRSVSYGTMYPLVTRLRRLGFVSQVPSPSTAGPPRNDLHLTVTGRQALMDWRSRWQETRAAVEDVLASLDRLESVND